MLDLVVTSRLGVRLGERPLMPEADLLRRIDLLERTSARSVAALRQLSRTWLIQTDASTVNIVAKALDRTTDGLAQLGIDVAVVGRIEDGFAPNALARVDLPERFLCLRLDSDDYYLPGPVAEALAKFEEEPVGTLVDFPRGFLVDLDAPRARRYGYSSQGPFHGIVTTPANPLAARGNHVRAREGRRCVEQWRRSWIQTVHSANDSTRYWRRGRIGEAKSMTKQILRVRRTRPAWQLAGRPLDLIPLTAGAQRSVRNFVN